MTLDEDEVDRLRRSLRIRELEVAALRAVKNRPPTFAEMVEIETAHILAAPARSRMGIRTELSPAAAEQLRLLQEEVARRRAARARPPRP